MSSTATYSESESSEDPSKKLQAVKFAMSHSFPTGDIDQMLTEIGLGYAAAYPGF